MKHVFRIVSIMFCVILILLICGCEESTLQNDKFYVTFKDYDGTILREEIIQLGYSATAPKDPVRYGYIFIGWDNEYTNIQKDTVLIARYERDENIIFEYTVTFVDYDGTILKEEVVKEGQDATAPTSPEREGYNFTGWNNDYFNINKDTTVKALYEEISAITKYTVTFVTNSEIIIENQIVEKGEKVTKPVDPTKKGYTFIGWYENNEEWNFNRFAITENTTIEAKWQINTYEITYDLNDADVTNPTTYTVEDEITLNNPTKVGYTFIGWTSDDILEPQLNVTLINETGNKNFVTHFIINTYTITFNTNGGEVLENYEIEYGELFDVKPVKEGSIFLGWYSDNKRIESGIWKYTEDLTLTAKWIGQNEVFEENGYQYIYIGRYPQTVVSDHLLIEELNLISEENEFGYIEYNGSEYKKAVAQQIGISLTFNNGNALIEGNTYYFKVEPIKWRILEENNKRYKLLCEMIIDRMEFDQNSNNYEYSNIRAWLNGYDGTSGGDKDYTNKGFIDIAFTNIEKELINNTSVDNSFESTGYTDKWLITEYICNNTIDKIYLLSRSDVLNTKYGFSSDCDATDPARRAVVSDYTRSKNCWGVFDESNNYVGHWWLRSPYDSNFIVPVVQDIGNVPNGNSVYIEYRGVRPAMTITLDQTNVYEVLFKDDNDNNIKTEYVKKGENAIPPTNVEKPGYTFIGWNIDITNIQNDLVVVAIYIPIKYNVTLSVNGGDPLETNEIEIEYDSIFDIIPQRDGYIFLGWYTENDELVELGPWKETIDVTLVAKWKEIKDTTIEIYEENGKKYINLGRYPQTVVTNTTTINALSKITTTNEFGYIEYNGKEYKKIVANTFENGCEFVNGNIIVEGDTYYFLVEPIKWRVLEEKNGTYKLLSEMILDNTEFYKNIETRTINGKTIFRNNYEYSNIRAWLNGYDGSNYNVEDYSGLGFYDIAFTKEEKLLINTTLVDNNLTSTGDSSNEYICNNTTDKIYLLSRKDMINISYGFSSDYFEHDTARRAQVSDYARSKSCYMPISSSYYGNGYWWLRSPNADYNFAREVNDDGAVYSYGGVGRDCYGVRPALTITI